MRAVLTVLVMSVVAAQVASGADGSVRIARVSFDPPGSDTGTNASLVKEYVEFRNTRKTSVSLRGWSLRDEDGKTYRFGNVAVPALGLVRVHTGRGRDTRSDLFWGLANYVWNNSGDTATLRSARGTVVSRCKYKSSGSVATC